MSRNRFGQLPNVFGTEKSGGRRRPSHARRARLRAQIGLEQFEPRVLLSAIMVNSSENWSAITGGSGAGGQPTAADSIMVENGAVLTVNVMNGAVGSIQIGGTGPYGILSFNTGDSVNVAGNVTLGGGGYSGLLDMSQGGTLAIGGAFTLANGGFTAGTGTIDYNGTVAQTVTGTSYNNLTLDNPAGASLSATTTANAALTLMSGALDMAGNTLSVGSVTGTGTVTSSTGAPTFTVADTTPDLFSGLLTGSLALTQDGTGTLTLSGNNSYTGLTTISAGTLQLGADGTSPDSPLGTTGAGTIVDGGAVLDLNGYSLATPEPLTLNGTGISNGGALINSSSSAATYSGLITLGSDSSILANAGTINLTNTGTITGSGFGLTLGGSGDGTLGSTIGTGAGTVTKSGTGTWTLSGDSTYTGLTTISAGTLQLGTSSNGGGDSPLGTTDAGTIVDSGAALDLNGYSLATAEPLTLNGTGISGGGALINSSSSAATYSGPITLGGDSSIVANAGNIVLNGSTITGTGYGLTLGGSGNGTLSSAIDIGAGTVTKSGAGTWTLSGDSTYTGLTTISAGTLQLGAAGTAPDSPLGTTDAGTIVDSGAALDLNGYSLATAEPLTLNGTGISNGGALVNSSGNAATYSGLITLGSDSSIVASAGDIDLTAASPIAGSGFGLTLGGSANGTLSGPINTDAGTLTINGTGTWTLSGASSYTGTTTVSSGTLLVDGSLASGSAVSVAGGATLGGGTTITSGTVSGTVADSGIISPGESYGSTGTGVLNTGDLTFNSGSVFNVDLNGTTAGSGYDELNVTGTATLGGNAVLNVAVASGFTPAVDSTFTIVNASTSLTGIFSGLASGAVVEASTGQFFAITYTGTTAVLTLIQEPVPTTVYVNAAWAGDQAGTAVTWTDSSTHYIGYDAFATIQGGVNAVATSGTVDVAAGSYVGDLVIPKSLNLTGAGASVVTVYPSDSILGDLSGGDGTELGSSTTMVLVQADNVTISGFTFDGANPNLQGSGQLVGGAYINARNGIVTDFNQPFPITGLVIDDNTIENIYVRGIEVASTYGTFTIDHNTVTNVQGDPESAIAIFNDEESGTIEYNTVSDAEDGIDANWSFGTEIAYNTISDSASGIHTDNSDGYGGGTPDSIHNNTVEDGTANSYGIWVFVPYDTVSVQNNMISDVSVGLALFGGAGGSASFSGNTVTGNLDPNGAGYYQTDDQLGYGAGDDSAIFDDNTISNFAVGVQLVQSTPSTTSALSMTGGSISGATDSGSGAGIDLIGGSTTITGVSISDSDTGIDVDGSTYSASVTFGAGNSISGGTTGLALNGSGVSVAGNTLNNIAFSGQSGNYITLSSAALGGVTPTTLDASQASFGDFVGADGVLPTDLSTYYGVEDKITDYLDDSTLGYVSLNSTNVFVDQLSEQTNAGALQRGINVAPSGGTVNVQGGSTEYVANSTQNPGGLYIGAPLTLLGAQAGIDPRSGRAGAESTIVPGVSDPDLYDSTAVEIVYVDSSNVTIDGFTVDGDNPNLAPSGVTLNGANIDAAEGIVSYTGVGNITVQNNIIENTTYTGIDFDNYENDAATDGNTITQNLIQNLGGGGYGYGIGVLLYNNFYASVTDNSIQDVVVGVQTGNFSIADPGDPATTATISGNTIATYSVGIFYNLMYGDSSTFTVDGNDITAFDDPTDGGMDWTGFLITSIENAVNASFVGNTIDGGNTAGYTTVEGYTVWNTSTTGNLEISGGTVSGVDTGVWVNNYEGYDSDAGASTQVTVSGVSITASQIGVYVQDDPASGTDPSVSAVITGGTVISGSGATGIEVSGSNASVSFSGTLPVYLDSGLAEFIVLADGAMAGSTRDASQVAFGSTGGSGGFVGADGDPATDLSTYYGIEDKITDYLDESSLGYVSLNSTNVFVTPSSESATAGAIQRGINVAANGDTVYVDAGTYNITSGLTITQSQLTLMGAMAGTSGSSNLRGLDESTLDGPTTTSTAAFNIPNSSNITIDGFTLDGMNSPNGSKIIGSEPASVQLSLVDNVFDLNAMHASGGTNIILSNPQSLTLTDNAFTTTGFSLSNSAVIQIAGNYTGTGSADEMDITGNTFTGIGNFSTPNPGSGQSTLQLNLAGVQGLVENNTFNGVDIGILVANSTGNLTISGNTFENITRGAAEISSGSYGAGIAFFDPAYSGPITVSDNTFENSDTGMRTSTDGVGGPYTLNSATVSLTGNTFTGDVYDIVDKFAGELDPDGTTSFDGVTLSAATTTQLYAIQDKIVDAIDVSGYGLVRLKAGNVYVTPNSYFTPGGTTTASIQRGINAATVGDTVNIAAGTYVGDVTINQDVNLVGAGSDSDPASNTIVEPGSAGDAVITVQASGASSVSPLTVSNLMVTGGAYGFYFNSTVANITIDNVAAVSNTLYGIEVHNSAVLNNLVLTDVSLTGSSIGFRVSSTGQVNGLTVTGSHFDDDVEGLYTTANTASTTNQNSFTNIQISSSTFNDDLDKGIYVEELNNATLSDITLTDSGTAGGSPEAININLKYGTYSNIAIDGAVVTDDTAGAATTAVAIAARNDSYGAATSLSGLSLTDVTVNDTTAATSIDLSIGNNITGITFSGIQLEGTGVGLVYFVTAATPLNLADTSFAGTLAGYVINSSANAVDATEGATFNGFDTGTGTLPADLATYFAIQEKIADAVDVSGYGLVRLLADNVFVTPESFFTQGGTTSPSIQRGIDAASAGDTVNVEGGTYTGDVIINKNVSIVGEDPVTPTTIVGTVEDTVNLSNVTFSYLDFTNDQSGDISDSGVSGTLFMTATTTLSYSDVTFDNDDFQYTGTTAPSDYAMVDFWNLDVSGADGLQFTNTTFNSGDPTGNSPAATVWLQATGGPLLFDNVINEGHYNGADEEGSQINIGTAPTDVTIENSSTADGGNYYLSGVTGLTIDNNTFDASGLALNGVTNASIYDNTFQNISDSIDASGGGENRAIVLKAAWGEPSNDNVQIYDNAFVNLSIPAFVLNQYTDADGNPLTPTASTFQDVSLYDNDFSGVTTGPAIDNTYPTDVTIDAEDNWWGSPTGPTIATNPGGVGVGVSDGVDFSPWLASGVNSAAGLGFIPTSSLVYAVPTQLVFTTQPSYATTDPSNAGTPFTTQPVLEAEDADGNLGYNFDGSLGTIDFSLTANPASGVLQGTTTWTASHGILDLTSIGNLGITAPGSYQLVASGPNFSTGVTNATSNTIDIDFATPTLSTVLPAQVAVGTSSPLDVTLTGTGFAPGSQVFFDSTNLTADIVSQTATTIVVSVPASLFGAIHTYDVVVANPVIDAGTGGDSNGEAFAVEAVPTTVYVDAAWAGDLAGTAVTWTDSSTHYIGYDAFATIQGGVNAVAASGTVDIAAGNYYETNIVVANPMTIVGSSKSGVIVAPAIADDRTGDDNAFVIQSSGVTIEDLTVDGNANTALDTSSGQTQNYFYGVTTVANPNDTVSWFNDTTVTNVSFDNIYYAGVFLYTDNGNFGATTGNSVSDSSFDSIGTDPANAGYAILFLQSSGSITDNTITNSGNGIGTNFVNQYPSYAPTVAITGNNLSEFAAVGGSVAIYGAGLALDSQINDNTIDTTGDGTADYGIILDFLSDIRGTQLDVCGNSITTDGDDVGIMISRRSFGVSSEFAPVLASGNWLTQTGLAGSSTGILVTDNDEPSSYDNADGVVTGNTIVGYGTGIDVDQVLSSTIVTATITGNSITGAAGSTGILVQGTNASAAISGGTITGNQTGIEFTGGGSGSVDGVAFDSLNSPNVTDLAVDSGAGIVTVGATTPNAFGASGTYIDNTSPQYINATNNTFGGVDPETATLSELYGIQNEITDALDNEAYGLVLIVPDNVYVTQNNESDNDNSQQDAIQRGIDAATNNGLSNVYVQAGTYQANSSGDPGGTLGGLIVNAPLNILGPNALINPNTGLPVAPAIILPSAVGTDPSSDSFIQLFYLYSSDVTIEGFTIDGYNQALTDSGITVGGVDVDAGEAIASYQGVGGITVENNIIENFSYDGVEFYNYSNSGTATTDNIISDNEITNIGYPAYQAGVGVLIYNNFYASVSNNTITGVNVGVQTGNFSSADPGDPATTAQISGNTIATYGVGVFYNLMYGESSTFTVEGNDITAVDDPTDGGTDWTGFLITSIQDAVSASFVDNTIDGTNTSGYSTVEGYTVWNTPTTGNLEISGGTVSGVDTGVWVNNYEGYDSDAGAPTQVTVSGVSITASQIGVYVQDDPASGTDPSVSAVITGGTVITGDAAIGIEVSGSNASVSFSGTLPAYLDSGLAEFIVLAGGAMAGSTLDASQVSFGSTGGSGGFVGADGDPATDLSTYYGIEDKIGDYLDDPTLGYVSLNATNVFVDQVSETTNAGAIQRGINVAPSFGTVNVQAGTYVATGSYYVPGGGVNDAGVINEINIDKPLTLLGPIASLDPNSPPVSSAQAIIQPGASDPNPFDSAAISIIGVSSSDVTIEGMTIDGSNSVTPGFDHYDGGTITFNGQYIDASEGISSNVEASGITIEHNIVEYVANAGIDFESGSSDAATDGNTISQNLIQDLGGYGSVGYGDGVVIYNNFYANVTSNVISNVGTGVQNGNYSQADPGDPALTASISDNTITTYGVGIFYNLMYGSSSPIEVSGNTISASAVYDPTADFPWTGFLIISLEGDVDASFDDNTVDGTNAASYSFTPITVGYTVWNTPTTGSVTINGGSVTGVENGIWVNNFEGYDSDAGASTQVTVSGVSITASQIGVYVQDDPASGTDPSVSAVITGGTVITGDAAIGIEVSGSNASVSFSGTLPVYLDSGLAEFIVLAGGAMAGSTLDASQVSFGSTGGSGGFVGAVGDPATDLSTYYGIEDKITDYLDDPTLGYVSLNATNVFVDQASESTNAGAIQRGINVAPSFGTVNVQAGTYVATGSYYVPGGGVNDAGVINEINIDKPLTLLGPIASLDPNSPPVSSAQAIIEPGASDPNPFDSTAVSIIGISSSNVTIEGITLDGNNSVTPGFVHYDDSITFNGVIIDASEGISSNVDASGITIEHNIVEYVANAGIDFENGGSYAATDGNTISQNLIQDLGGYGSVGYGFGVVIYNNFYANVNDNVMTNVAAGVQNGNYYLPDPGDASSNATISDNTISAYVLGIFYNLMYATSSTIEVSGNIITASTLYDSTASAFPWTGFLITSLQSDVTASFDDNQVDGSNAAGYSYAPTTAGYTIWNTPTTGSVAINGGSVTGVENGIWVNNFEGYDSAASGSTQVTVSGVSITASQIGVYVQDDPASGTDPSVSAVITGGTVISGSGATGIEVSGSNASVSFSGTLPVYLDSGLAEYIVLADGAMAGSTLDASQVSFDGFVGATGVLPDDLASYFAIEDKVTDYLDDPTLGYVSLKSDPVFVAQSSEIANAGAIQRGVNVAAANDTVYVQGGAVDYAGDVTIDEPLILSGANVGVNPITGVRGAESVVDGPDFGFWATANDVTINGFTIQGVTGGDNAGIYLPGSISGYQILNNIIQDNVMGIYANSDGTFASLIQYNLIQDNTVPGSGSGNGIYTDQNSENLTIDSNKFVDNDITFAATGTTINSGITISNNDVVGGADAGEVTLLGLTSSSVTGNTITGSPYTGLGLLGGNDGVTISDNTINGADGGIGLFGNPYNLPGGNDQNISISGNTITDDGTGILVENGDSATITNNDLASESVGVQVGSDAGDTSTATINDNDFTGDTTGVENLQSAGTIDATQNWWGTLHGPTTTANPGGNGAAVSGNVDFSPWIGIYTSDANPGFDPTAITLYAVPTELIVVTQPSSTATINTPFATQPEFEAVDADGNLGINFDSSTVAGSQVNLTLNANPGSGTLAGTYPVDASGGYATFTDLNITLQGSYTLTASALPTGDPWSDLILVTPDATTDTIVVTGQAIPVVHVSDLGGTYNGTAFAATATLTPHDAGYPNTLEGVPLSFTYYVGIGTSGTNLGGTAPTNAGTYTVVADFPGNADYTSASDMTSFTITPAELDIYATSATKVYDGTTSDSAAPTYQVAGEPVDTLYGVDSLMGLTQAFTSKNVAGTNGSTLQIQAGYVVNDSNGGANYTVVLHTAAGTITRAQLDIYATSATKVYDGTTSDSAAPTYQVAGEPVDTLYDDDSLAGLVQAFTSKDVVGTNLSTLQVQAGYVVDDGNHGANYTVVLYSASGTITPAELDISATSDTKVYDDTISDSAAPTFQVAGKPVDTLYSSDSLTGVLVQAFTSKDVLGTDGSTLQVQAGYGVNDGNGGADYTVVLHTALGTITPANLYISATSDSRVYNGTVSDSAAPTFQVASEPLDTLYDGDSLAGLVQAFTSKDVLGTDLSTLQVQAGYVVNDGNHGANYTVVVYTASGTITPAELDISATSDTKVYDDTTSDSAAPTFQVAGKPLNTLYDGDALTGLVQAFTSKNVAGTNGSTLQVQAGYAVNDGNGGADYTVVLHTALGTITPKALTMSGLSVPASKVYDGTTTAVVSGSPGSLQAAEAAGTGTTADGAPYSGDTVSITGTATGIYNSADVATATTVTFGGVSLTGAQAGDYTLTIQSPVSATITPAVLMIATPPPAGVLAGQTFGLTVDELNAENQINTSYNGSLTVSLANNPGDSTLGGALTVQAVNGVATFSGLTINNPGLAYTLQVSVAGAYAKTTTPFDVAGYELVANGPTENLVWFGTTGNDQVQFTQTDADTVQITVSDLAGIATNFMATITGVTGSVVANEYDLAGGADVVDGSGLTTIPSYITVGDGNDTLIGGGGANTIIAGDGDNMIYGNGIGNSPLSGVQDPSNTITVGNGDNIIYGNYSGSGYQGGNNTITAGNGNNTIYGNYGNGGYTGDGAEGSDNTITVGDGANTIYGNYGNADGGEGGSNTIVAGNGNDIIYGNADGDDPKHKQGSNFIQVGNGNDTIYGNLGGDGGEGGNNTILTGSGTDTIYGNFGGDGGEGGNNLIVAGGGNDTIYAHSALPATSTTSGATAAGRDLIIGGTGADTVYGWPAGYTLGSNTGDLFVAGTTNLSLTALDAVLAEWDSSDSYATRVADLGGSNGPVGANGSNYLISGTTVFGSAAVDEIFGTADSDDDWYLVTSNDVLNNVDPDDVTQIN